MDSNQAIRHEDLIMYKQAFSISTIAVGTLIVASSVSADMQGISVDAIDSGFGIGTTYRVYVDVDTGDQVDAIWGDGDNPLIIESSTSFYQNQFGGYGTPSESLFSFFPSLEYDSFVTIGLLNDTGDAMMDIGIDWTDFEDNGGAIWTDNGTWFATPDDPQVFEQDGRVLIGQFTTDGVGAFDDGDTFGYVNILGKNADLTSWEYREVPLPIPAPGAIALLGLAGFLGVRRRK
jgi:hypothetical protein